MSEIIENTFTAYLGSEFQRKLMWQLLVEPEFAEKIIPNLAIEYFDDLNYKRLFVIILEYYKEFEKVPNFQNKSIHQAIKIFVTPNNKIEEETLFGILSNIELWNERILNKQMLHDGDVVQKSANRFIKQQEYRKLGEFIIEKTKNGEIKEKHILSQIEEKFLKIAHIGEEEDNSEEVIDEIDRALRKEFREPIPTGVEIIDALTGGGLGKCEIGIILTPSGIGKSSLLTKIANTAYDLQKNVAQIIFEDTIDQIKRKHYAIWSKIPLSKMDDDDTNPDLKVKIHEKAEDLKNNRGKLIIKKFSQENTTMLDIRNWITWYQKKWGIKFDVVVLDYLDCLESHKKTPDRTEAELIIVKSFEAMASDFNIPAWSAIQSNRGGFDAEFVEAHHTGGSIKRVQKSHFFMTVAKTPEQKEANLANIRIIKARFAQDGQTFENAIFNNDTMQISIEDSKYKFKAFRGLKKYNETDVDDVENKRNKLNENEILDKSTALPIHTVISSVYDENTIKNNDIINKDEEVIELDTTLEITKCDVKTPDVNENINNNKIEDKNDDIIGWTGETFTNDINETEVKFEDIEPQKNEEIIKTEPPKILIERKKVENINVDEIEKMLIINPDEPQGSNKNVFEILKKAREYQDVIRKE